MTRGKPASKAAAKPSASGRNLTTQQIAAGTQLYNAFCAAGSTVKLAQFATGMANHGVWSKKEAADTLGITTTTLNQASAGKVDGTGASDERRENLRRLAATRLGIAFGDTAFASAQRSAAAARARASAQQKAADTGPTPVA